MRSIPMIKTMETDLVYDYLELLDETSSTAPFSPPNQINNQRPINGATTEIKMGKQIILESQHQILIKNECLYFELEVVPKPSKKTLEKQHKVVGQGESFTEISKNPRKQYRATRARDS